VFDAGTTALLESGCALIIGTVDADGAPWATRGWGLDVQADEPARVRLIVDADDERTTDNLSAGRPVAVTGASVLTLESVQLKGTSLGLQPGTPDDEQRAQRYADAFFDDIHDTDGTDHSLLELMRPAQFASCELLIDELYDQTPGPSAGSALSGAS
jgi:hypothetical protein